MYRLDDLIRLNSVLVIIVRLEYPTTLPASHNLHQYLTSSEYLTNIIWKIVFSPCSQYLAIPKQDIYGRYCVLVLRCSDWNTHDFSEKFPLEHQFFCSAAVWSLTFAQSRCPSSSLLGPDAIAALPALRDPSIRRRSSVSVVNRRYDLTKNLFLAAGLADGKINIWNIQTGELTLILKDHGSTVCGLDLSSSTMQLASSSCDKTIKLWNLLDDGKNVELRIFLKKCIGVKTHLTHESPIFSFDSPCFSVTSANEFSSHYISFFKEICTRH